MALIVEDGTIVENANSYLTLAAIRSYAASRGVTLSAVDATLEAQVLGVMTYLESFRAKYQGVKVSSAQSLQWPRYGVYIDGFAFESNEIPIEIKNAECELVISVHSGVDLMPNVTGNFVTFEKVGPIETRYSEYTSTSGQPSLPIVDSLLKPLLKQNLGMGLVRL